MQPVPVRFQIPDAFRAKAWYALEELLGGLGLCPVEAGAEAPALIYGPEAHANAIWLPFTEGTLSPFEVGGVIPEAPRSWRLHDGTQIPIAFGTAEAPDLIASAFLWLSGWAEHRSAHRDRHGRVPFAASLAARWGVPPSLPVVDAYRATLADQLYSSGFSVAITDPPPTAPWALCVTCDVDHVRYGRLRRAARTLASGRVTEALRVVSAWARPTRDPFRSALVHIAAATVARCGQATFLFKAGATDPHDVPYRLDAPWLRRLATDLTASGHELGLHPGYGTPERGDLLDAEVQRFEAAFHRRPASVRQHYLRHAGTVTSRLHVEAGLRVDNTLGWSDVAGFRYGTCRPFRPYDAEANAPLPLTEVPLAWMDTGAFGTRGLNLDGAWAETEPLLEAARKYGGVFAGLWHNTFLSHDAPTARHLERTLDYAAAHNAVIVSLGYLAPRP